MIRRWGPRIGTLLLLAIGGQMALTVLDFEPDLLRWSLMATASVVLLWLVLDVLQFSGAAEWDDPLAPYARPDAADDSVYHRVLGHHLDASTPGPGLRDLIIDLARWRDPALSEPALRALANDPVRRMSSDDIDRYLTLLEDPRERD